MFCAPSQSFKVGIITFQRYMTHYKYRRQNVKRNKARSADQKIQKVRIGDNKEASSNKCIATSNKCLTSSNKKLVVTSASLLTWTTLQNL